MIFCSCGMAIHPDYPVCESCEYHECPACGVEMSNLGFCATCIENGDGELAIDAAVRWAGSYT